MIRDAVVLGILPLENRELGAKLSLQAFSTELFLFSDNRVAPGNIKFLARSGFPGGISQANAIFGFFLLWPLIAVELYVMWLQEEERSGIQLTTNFLKAGFA